MARYFLAITSSVIQRFWMVFWRNSVIPSILVSLIDPRTSEVTVMQVWMFSLHIFIAGGISCPSLLMPTMHTVNN